MRFSNFGNYLQNIRGVYPKRPWDIVISTNNLACVYTQPVCDKNSRNSCIFFHRFLHMASTELFIIDHFEGFFMEISTFLCSLYVYVNHQRIKTPMPFDFESLGKIFFFFQQNTFFKELLTFLAPKWHLTMLGTI